MALFSNFRARAKSEAPVAETGNLDVMARLLRTWGQHAFDIDQLDAETFQQRCEGWARHVLTGTPAPTARGPVAEQGPDATTRRRYADLLQEMQRHRQSERSYVNKTMSGLKGAVWDMVTQLQEAATAHARDDEALQSQLSRLESLLAGDDVSAIRSAAAETVKAVSSNIAARQQRNAQQLATLGSRMKTLESSLVEVRSLNRLDALTGLQNRGALDEALPRMVTMAGLSQEPLTILMVDIDHFKQINDTHGHPTGDAVLRDIGDALVRAFPRKSDYLARYGGEEFCVVLPTTGLEDSRRLAERFLTQLRSLEITHDTANLRITASIGVATAGPQEKPDSIIARADRALYSAKRNGRDRVELAEPPT